MKKLLTVVTASVLTLSLAAAASAQTRPSSQAPTRESRDTAPRRDAAERPAWAPEANAVETSKIIGMRVRTADGKNVAEVDQLIVNPSDGKITHVVLGKGGMLGIGETKLVVSWSDLKIQRDTERADRWVAVVDRGKLDTAPRFEARRDRDTAPAASPSAPASRPSEPAKKY